MTASTNSQTNDRHQRKRIAARIRQQRCRARKREAKMAEMAAQKDSGGRVKAELVGARRPPVPVVKGPVLTLRNTSRLGDFQIPSSTVHHYQAKSSFDCFHPTSRDHNRFYPTRSPPFTPYPIPQGFVVTATPPRIHTTFTMVPESSCLTPPTLYPKVVPVPRVSPIESLKLPTLTGTPSQTNVKAPVLDVKEETAIDAMLTLHRSGSNCSNGSSCELGSPINKRIRSDIPKIPYL